MLIIVLAIVPPGSKRLAEALIVPAASLAVLLTLSWAFVVMLLTETFADEI